MMMVKAQICLLFMATRCLQNVFGAENIFLRGSSVQKQEGDENLETTEKSNSLTKKTYSSTDMEECYNLAYICPDNTVWEIEEGVGCGCVPQSGATRNGDNFIPGTFFSNNLAACYNYAYRCPQGVWVIQEGIGCGCVPIGTENVSEDATTGADEGVQPAPPPPNAAQPDAAQQSGTATQQSGTATQQSGTDVAQDTTATTTQPSRVSNNFIPGTFSTTDMAKCYNYAFKCVQGIWTVEQGVGCGCVSLDSSTRPVVDTTAESSPDTAPSNSADTSNPNADNNNGAVLTIGTGGNSNNDRPLLQDTNPNSGGLNVITFGNGGINANNINQNVVNNPVTQNSGSTTSNTFVNDPVNPASDTFFGVNNNGVFFGNNEQTGTLTTTVTNFGDAVIYSFRDRNRNKKSKQEQEKKTSTAPP